MKRIGKKSGGIVDDIESQIGDKGEGGQKKREGS
jgi:hypothetical protein